MPKLTAQQRERTKSRTTEGDFIRITKFVTRNPQFWQLSSDAMRVLLVLLHKYNGKNNGDLSIPRSELAQWGFGMNGRVLRRALQELDARGYVIVTRHGGWETDCSLFGISIEPMDASPKHEWPTQHAAMHYWRDESRSTVVVQGQEPSWFKKPRKAPPSRTVKVPVKGDSGKS